MSFRTNYWSNSAPADWIRGTPKGGAKTPEDWDAWKEQARLKHPLRFWIAEEGLDRIQDVLNWPIDVLTDARYYVNNRWVSRSHALTSKLEKGKWHEFDTRMLHCMFDELVNFVEIEQAWMQVVFDESERKKYAVPWWRKNPFRIRRWRSAAAGMAYLEWAASLTWNEDWVSEDDPNYGQPTQQAETARETIALYKWWTEVRPARPDPYDASGWTEFCEKRKNFLPPKSEEEKQESGKILDALHNMEEEYEREDTEMMIRLIRIRKGLWT